MLQTNDPEIQAKLAAMQKQMTLESATPDSSRPTTQQLMAVLQRQQHTHAEVTRSKVKVVTQEQREHKARWVGGVCGEGCLGLEGGIKSSLQYGTWQFRSFLRV